MRGAEGQGETGNRKGRDDKGKASYGPCQGRKSGKSGPGLTYQGPSLHPFPALRIQ